MEQEHYDYRSVFAISWTWRLQHVRDRFREQASQWIGAGAEGGHPSATAPEPVEGSEQVAFMDSTTAQSTGAV